MAATFGHEGDRLSALLDDELSPKDGLEVARHLARCEACSDELEALRSMRTALRGLPGVETPLSFMVEQVLLGPRDEEQSAAITAAWLTVAAGAMLLVGAFLLGGTVQGAVRPPVDALVVDHVRSVEGGPVVVPVRLDTTSASVADR